MRWLVAIVVVIGCGAQTPPSGDPVTACVECGPGALLHGRFVDDHYVVFAASPEHFVYRVGDEVVWADSDFAVFQAAGIADDKDRNQTIVEIAVASDGTVVAGTRLGDVGTPHEYAVTLFEPDGSRRWQHQIAVETTVAIGSRFVFLTSSDPRPIQIGDDTIVGPYLAALDRTNGSLAWVRTMPSRTQLTAVGDSSGGVVVAGTFSGTLDLGDVVLANGLQFPRASGFVAQLDDLGVARWGVQLDTGEPAPGLNAFARVEKLALGPRGSVAFAATWFGGVPTILGASDDLDGTFVALIDASGAVQWARDLRADRVSSLLTDGVEIVVAGHYLEALSYDGVLPIDEHDGYIAAITREGPRWVRHATGAGRQIMSAASFTTAGGISAVMTTEYNFEDGPKPASYGDVVVVGNGAVIGELAR